MVKRGDFTAGVQFGLEQFKSPGLLGVVQRQSRGHPDGGGVVDAHLGIGRVLAGALGFAEIDVDRTALVHRLHQHDLGVEHPGDGAGLGDARELQVEGFFVVGKFAVPGFHLADRGRRRDHPLVAGDHRQHRVTGGLGVNEGGRGDAVRGERANVGRQFVGLAETLGRGFLPLGIEVEDHPPDVPAGQAPGFLDRAFDLADGSLRDRVGNRDKQAVVALLFLRVPRGTDSEQAGQGDQEKGDQPPGAERVCFDHERIPKVRRKLRMGRLAVAGTNHRKDTADRSRLRTDYTAIAKSLSNVVRKRSGVDLGKARRRSWNELRFCKK